MNPASPPASPAYLYHDHRAVPHAGYAVSAHPAHPAHARHPAVRPRPVTDEAPPRGHSRRVCG